MKEFFLGFSYNLEDLELKQQKASQSYIHVHGRQNFFAD